MGGVTGGLEKHNHLIISGLAKNTGGLRRNKNIHVLQKKCKHYLEYHFDGWAVIATR